VLSLGLARRSPALDTVLPRQRTGMLVGIMPTWLRRRWCHYSACRLRNLSLLDTISALCWLMTINPVRHLDDAWLYVTSIVRRRR
jgi:hypothetical protein